MQWNKYLLEEYAKSYVALKNYDIFPWEVADDRVSRGETSLKSPFETQAIMNADFDTALNRLGKGHWTGDINDIENKQFKDFRYFGRLQRVVIARIYGIEDWELEAMGFDRVPRLRAITYRRMLDYLNE